MRPEHDLGLLAEATTRLLRTLASIDDTAARAPSRLPGWTVGHVVTHLARNADSHTRRSEAALRGEVVPQYAGGAAGRAAEIERGASRPASELVTDLQQACATLDEIWARFPEEAWHRTFESIRSSFPAHVAPLRRLVEVELHHVDLGLGYGAADWSQGFVDRALPFVIGGLERGHADVRGPAVSWHLHRTDGDGEWIIARAPNGTTVVMEHGDADSVLTGPGHALLAWLTTRNGDEADLIEIAGESELARHLQEAYPYG